MRDLRVESMYAYLMVDPDDNNEGVAAFLDPAGMWQPMVGADLERAESLRPHVVALARATGRTVTLAHFTVRTDVETFE